jgi:hypothetical protein
MRNDMPYADKVDYYIDVIIWASLAAFCFIKAITGQ